MAYLDDPELEFLARCDNQDLDLLVQVLIADRDGDPRWTEELTSNEDFKRYSPDHQRYWQAIAAEIQCFGGNTIATLIRRGHGVRYREVLCDVCDKLEVNYNKEASVEVIEMCLLMKILIKAIGDMTEEELRALIDELGLTNTSVTGPAVVAAMQASVHVGGFMSYQIAVIVANSIVRALLGRGLSLAANAALTRGISVLAGPIGIAATALWTTLLIAGPAYRVTTPATALVAYMRQKKYLGER